MTLKVKNKAEDLTFKAKDKDLTEDKDLILKAKTKAQDSKCVIFQDT